ncbi:MAG: DUF4011 domain-containing protein, partial [Clostridia bacterium]|nr:DUF4011 domain-containing protein [Clostridia bacterium]
MQDTQYLDGFIGELLHINEVSDNKLIDLGANNKSGTYVLSRTAIDVSAYALGVISERLGKTANTILLNSALSSEEQRVNRQINAFEWCALDGSTDKKALHTFIENARKELALRGNNTLFLSVGALKWRVATTDKGKECLKDVTSPFLIFPVRLVAGGKTAPVAIEFIDDDIYINPCLIAKLSQLYGQELVNGLPKIGGADVNDPVDMEKLGDGVEYFKQLKDYIDGCNHSELGENTLFEFDKDQIAVAQYKHDELCTYYDIRRNKDKIYSHPLVEKIFVKSDGNIREIGGDTMPRYILPHDSVQEKIIEGVVNGQSMIIKGPPGTGKTVTIANMIAALLAENKKVLFASKKISALGEVYAKLPERLRKFTMLLDSETESNAAKIKPDEIKNNFKVLISNRKQYKESATLNGDYSQTSTERAAAMRSLSTYIQTMYNGDCIAGDSFYNALDVVCKNQLPVINFADDNDVLGVSREQYAHMLSRIGEAERCFNLLSDDGKHAAYKCPWFGIDLSCDSERALSACVKLGSDAESVLKEIEGGLSDCGLDAGAFTLMQIYRLHGLKTEKDAVKKIIEDKSAQTKIAEISRRLEGFLSISDGADTGVNLPNGERLESLVIRLGGLGVDEGLTLDEIKCVSANAEIFYQPDGSFISSDVLVLVSKVVNEIEVAQKAIAEHTNAAYEVFKSNLNSEELKVVSSAISALSGYFNSCPEKPKALDFKGKKAYANLCALSYLSSPSFKDIVTAVKAFAEAKKIAAGIAETEERVFKFFKRKLTSANLDCIKLVLSKCADELIRTCAFVEAVSNNCAFIEQCYAYVEGADILTLGQLIGRFERAYRLELLAGALEDFNQLTPVYAADNKGSEVEIAYGLIAAGSFISTCLTQSNDEEKITKAFDFIRGLDKSVIELVGGICGGLESFGARYFRNYFVINGEDNTFEDLKILSAQAGNRDVISAAVRYGTIKNDPANALDLNGFLYWFEKGGIIEGATFADAFE